jgi:hypothetical protein
MVIEDTLTFGQCIPDVLEVSEVANYAIPRFVRHETVIPPLDILDFVATMHLPLCYSLKEHPRLPRTLQYRR